MGRLTPGLLALIEHRSEEVQADLAVIRSSEAVVEARTALIGHVRSSIKTLGSCSTDSFHRKVEDRCRRL